MMAGERGQQLGSAVLMGVTALLLIWLGWVAATRPHSLSHLQDRPQATQSPVSRPHLTPLRIDINTATASELTLLPRVGPRLSQRIVAWRQSHGPFTSLADLQAVPGIGPAIVEAASTCATAQPMAATAANEDHAAPTRLAER